MLQSLGQETSVGLNSVVNIGANAMKAIMYMCCDGKSCMVYQYPYSFFVHFQISSLYCNIRHESNCWVRVVIFVIYLFLVQYYYIYMYRFFFVSSMNECLYGGTLVDVYSFQLSSNFLWLRFLLARCFFLVCCRLEEDNKTYTCSLSLMRQGEGYLYVFMCMHTCVYHRGTYICCYNAKAYACEKCLVPNFFPFTSQRCLAQLRI